MGFLTGKTVLITGAGRAVLKDGINVNVVCPLAWTAKLEQFKEAYPDAFKANVKMSPMSHYGNAETEIGRVCVRLAMPDFKYMSGETLTLEGGTPVSVFYSWFAL